MQTINELPAFEDAERGIIGLTLIEKHIPAGARDLATTDFYNPRHRAAWSAFLELDEEGREIEPFSALEILKREKHTFSVAELTETTTGLPVGLNENVFVKKIKQASTRRYLIRELYSQIEGLQTGASASISGLKRKLDDLEAATEPAGHFKSLSEILEKEVKPALSDLRQGITHRIKTGFQKIDDVIGGGLSVSDILVVAALTSAGKSAFVLQMAVNIARQGIPVAFLSGEMTDKENGLRVISQASNTFNLNAATHISEEEHGFLTQWADALKKLPLYFDSKTSDLASVSRSLRSLVETVGIKVLVIDYIQLFKLNRVDRQTRTERIAEASQEVKRIAMEYGLAVIEVVQFNREGAKSLKTSIHDLEGSSQLEKDASLIFILDRNNDQQDVTLRIVKGRNTGKCEIEGRFTGYSLNFEF